MLPNHARLVCLGDVKQPQCPSQAGPPWLAGCPVWGGCGDYFRAEIFKVPSTNSRGARLALPEVFRSEVCQGFDYQAVCRVLLEHGCLAPDANRPFDCRPRLPGMGLASCYRITPALFALGCEATTVPQPGRRGRHGLWAARCGADAETISALKFSKFQAPIAGAPGWQGRPAGCDTCGLWPVPATPTPYRFFLHSMGKG